MENNRYDIIADLNTLTTIPVQRIQEFFEKMVWCICDDVEDTKLAKEKALTINIGIGWLDIYFDEDNVKYKYTPSNSLNKAVIKTLNEGKNPLEAAGVKALAEKFIKTYKEFI